LALLLNIDTATEYAGVCLSDNATVLAREQSNDQKNHATFIQPAIKKTLSASKYTLLEIDAVAVTAGPGSYTGLRVGLATAKGLCYALNKPLILINTLEIMAMASIEETDSQLKTGNLTTGEAGRKPETSNCLFCPMIDARRMEVFTAVYDGNLQPLVQPAAVILSAYTFKEYLDDHPIIFSGSGHIKFKTLVHYSNAVFTHVQHHVGHLAIRATKAFEQKQFADIAYSEPFYLKEFFTASQPSNR
jgi:tRNA threonylcarbamoyladenosine biosynthesis protein TsaB